MDAQATATKPPSQEELDAAKRLVDSIPPTLCSYGRREGSVGDAKTATCDELATWLLVLSCGHDAPLCDDHKTKIDRAIGRGFPVTCSNPKGDAGKAHPVGIRVTFEWRRL